jgi:hypothetical protein
MVLNTETFHLAKSSDERGKIMTATGESLTVSA